MKPYNRTQTKKEQIREMFDGIAPRYDMLNHLMTLGIDRRWRRSLVRSLAKEKPTAVLDLATGTGDLVVLTARKMPQVHVTASDISSRMLEIARRKVSEKGLQGRVSLSVGEAENLPFEEGAFDAVTVAFGVRNFENIPRGLGEMYHVTRPGGSVYVLELSRPRIKIFSSLFRFYFHRVLPLVGGWFSKDRKAYTYLPQSVDEFPPPSQFRKWLGDAGYKDCNAKPLFFGVAHIFKGIK